MKGIIKNETTRVVDFKTGEVVEDVQTNVVSFPKEPPYVKMYVADLCSLFGVADSDQALLRHLLVRLDYEGFVIVTTRVRASISRALSISPKTLQNRLSRLVQADLIWLVCRNEYKVNPHYFARGDWKSVYEQRKAYKMEITYGEHGRTVTTGVDEP